MAYSLIVFKWKESDIVEQPPDVMVLSHRFYWEKKINLTWEWEKSFTAVAPAFWSLLTPPAHRSDSHAPTSRNTTELRASFRAVSHKPDTELVTSAKRVSDLDVTYKIPFCIPIIFESVHLSLTVKHLSVSRDRALLTREKTISWKDDKYNKSLGACWKPAANGCHPLVKFIQPIYL